MRPHLALAAVLLVACGDLQPAGIEEPLTVAGAAFRPGDLPGSPPDTSSGTGPQVTAIELVNGVIHQGQRGRLITGRTSGDAHAVALRFAELGTGYWVKPVGGPEPSIPGELVFELTADFGEIEPGTKSLRFVALDGEGEPGAQRDLPVCVASDVPDNLNACDATQRPPAVIISLVWDTDADLDLIAVEPSGEKIDAREPVGAGDPSDPAVPKLSPDSGSSCIVDGRRRENLVFDEAPPAGTWLIYAQLFDACGTHGAAFRVEVYRRKETGEGTFALERSVARAGSFLSVQVSGGAGSPLFITPVALP